MFWDDFVLLKGLPFARFVGYTTARLPTALAYPTGSCKLCVFNLQGFRNYLGVSRTRSCCALCLAR